MLWVLTGKVISIFLLVWYTHRIKRNEWQKIFEFASWRKEASGHLPPPPGARVDAPLADWLLILSLRWPIYIFNLVDITKLLILSSGMRCTILYVTLRGTCQTRFSMSLGRSFKRDFSMLVNSKRGLILTLLCALTPQARVVTVLFCDVLNSRWIQRKCQNIGLRQDFSRDENWVSSEGAIFIFHTVKISLFHFLDNYLHILKDNDGSLQ